MKPVTLTFDDLEKRLGALTDYLGGLKALVHRDHASGARLDLLCEQAEALIAPAYESAQSLYSDLLDRASRADESGSGDGNGGAFA